MAKHVINNPGGRKPLPEEEKYGKPIPVRFTPKQFVRIKRKAGEMPISTYIREGALHAIVRQPVSKELMKEIRDLNNLGTNINTLVKLAHQIGLMTIADKANEALDGVNAILHQARLKIKEKEDNDESENQSKTTKHSNVCMVKFFMEHHSEGSSTMSTTHAKMRHWLLQATESISRITKP